MGRVNYKKSAMDKKVIFTVLIVITAFGVSCSREDRDTELPQITMSGSNHFPNNCDTVYIGESFYFRARFTDNYELGSYSIDVHHNFDHHSHSTDMTNCPMDPVRIPENPYLFIRQFDIPPGAREYDASQPIEVPAGVDPGDYHLMVRVTDRTGWQAIRGISIKVVER
jgi:hypothetical protein